MSSKSTIFWRVYLSFFAIVVLALLVLGKIVMLQTSEGKKWRNLADSLTTRYVEVEPNRGNIYSSDGRLLATSLYSYDLHMDLKTEYLRYLNQQNQLEDSLDALAAALANYFKGPNENTKWLWLNELKTAYAQGRRYHLIRNKINHIQLQDIRKFPLFRLGQYKGGLIVEQKSIRQHPYSLLAYRTIGYTNEENKVGLEGGFDPFLAGIKGKRLLQKVSSRDWIPIHDKNEIDPENGKDIYTTIDIYIQDFVETSLYNQLMSSEADHGCAIVMEVATGKVLAIANLTTNNGGKSYDEVYNYAIGESTQPGSTFKLAGLLALLEGGYMQLEDTIGTGTGKWEFYDQIMYDSKSGGHGTISLQRIIEVSSNIGIAKALDIHFGHQPDVFIDFLKGMRLHENLQLPIVGEPAPLIKTPLNDDWSGTTLPWMAHGYELKLTPLQTLMIYNAVANRGDIMKPLFVTAVKEIHKTVETYEPEIWARNVISEKTAELATKALIGVVETDGGTAHNLYRHGINIAGKTGTAVIGKTPDGVKKYQASFAGFFPAENPKYSCIVVINNPTEGHYYGADVAGPVFLEIAQNLYSYDISLNKATYASATKDVNHRPTFIKLSADDAGTIYKSLKMDLATDKSLAEWVEPSLTGNKISLTAKEAEPGTVPSLKGLSLSDALYICENMGLKVESSGTGNIYKQSPEPGTSLRKVSKIYVTLN
ncbi:PASTA domain-containing protein [bacterium]|nr:PASTA domain-containing protein [bacterium]